MIFLHVHDLKVRYFPSNESKQCKLVFWHFGILPDGPLTLGLVTLALHTMMTGLPRINLVRLNPIFTFQFNLKMFKCKYELFIIITCSNWLKIINVYHFGENYNNSYSS